MCKLDIYNKAFMGSYKCISVSLGRDYLLDGADV